MPTDRYVVATLKPWNVSAFEQVIRHFPGDWHLVTDPEELTPEYIESIAPKYVFFPHWSSIVSDDILGLATCIGFHETNLPYGRGGSPIQNLISRGHTETVICALRMSAELDAGPVYLREPLSLEGRAKDIFLEAASTIAQMIEFIVRENPTPVPQEGVPTVFKRRKPSESLIDPTSMELTGLYDHMRMLDADGYPRAFLEHGGFRFEFTRPSLESNRILANVQITKIEEQADD